MTTVRDIHNRRGDSTIGYNPHRFVELYGGEMVPISNYEPDPSTFRNLYYYNSRMNRLFKRIEIKGDRVSAYYWKSVTS